MANVSENIAQLWSEDENRSFCVSLEKNARQTQQTYRLPDFLPLIERSSVSWADIKISDFTKEAAETAAKFGFSEILVRRLLRNLIDESRLRGGYEDIDTEMGLLLPLIQVKDADIGMEPLLFLVKKNFILTLHNSEGNPLSRMHRYAEAFFKKLPADLSENDWLTLVLIRIIDSNNQSNFMQLQQIEEYSDNLSRDLSQIRYLPPELSQRIYHEKHVLIKYISGLWATGDVLSCLRNGDASLLTDNPGVLNKIDRMIIEVNGQIGVAEHISEVLASGLECLQSIYNNRLQILNNRLSIVNNRITLLMGWLTVVGTALLVPNTIATVVSQTNVFTFGPGDVYWYLTLIVGSTVIATLLSWLWVRQMGLMPKKGAEEDSGPIAAAEKEREEIRTIEPKI
jgi:magnesium transporter